MTHHTDWLPAKREARLEMSKVWAVFIRQKQSVLNVPTGVLESFEAKSAELERLCAAGKASRTPAQNTEIKELDDGLSELMRDIKRRYFFVPPLTDANLVTLGLHPKDSIPTPVSVPIGQAKADVTYPGGAQIQLRIQHVEGTPFDDRADYGYKIYYGLYGASATPPSTGKDLGEQVFARHKKTFVPV